jgi:hypothetical protein
LQIETVGIKFVQNNYIVMKNTVLFIVYGLFSILPHFAMAQKGYTGTLITKFGDTLQGIISFKMDKSNVEMIEITTSSMTNQTTNGNVSKSKSTEVVKLNFAIVNYVIISDSVYYFRDVKVKNQTSKYDRNMCLRLTLGSLKNGIFQIGNSNTPEKAVVSLPGKNNTYLVSPQDDYYAETGTWSILEYSECQPLKKKISAKQPGYIWNKDLPLSERLSLWRNWIIEYENCAN